MANVINRIINGGLNRLKKNLDNWENAKNNEELRQEAKDDAKEMGDYSALTTFKYGEKSADAQLERTKRLTEWENELNSPKNQIASLKEAGLSPSMMMSQGLGSGGVSQGTSGGGGSLSMPYDSASQKRMTKLAEQEARKNTALIGSQTALNMATAKKTKAETEDIEGIDRDTKEAGLKEIGARIDDIKETIESKKTQRTLTKVQIAIAENQEEFENESKADRLENLRENNRVLYQQRITLEHDNEIKKETKKDIIKTVANGALLGEWQIKAIEAGIKLTEQQVQKIIDDNQIELDKLWLKGREVTDKEINTVINAIKVKSDISNPTLLESLGGAVKNVIENGEKGIAKVKGQKYETDRDKLDKLIR